MAKNPRRVAAGLKRQVKLQRGRVLGSLLVAGVCLAAALAAGVTTAIPWGVGVAAGAFGAMALFSAWADHRLWQRQRQRFAGAQTQAERLREEHTP